MKQTAVEWLIGQMKTYNMTLSVQNTSHQNVIDFYKAVEEAKEMEKLHIIVAWKDGDGEFDKAADSLSELYYNETFKSKHKYDPFYADIINQAKAMERYQKDDSIEKQVSILKDTLEEMMTGFDSEENRIDFILDICNGYKKRINL
jgi:hypothetical protein